MRFKSAISRLKAAGASKEQVAAPGREMHVQCKWRTHGLVSLSVLMVALHLHAVYMPDQPWAGISTTKSSATQNERKLTQQKTRERVVTGREVEVAAREAHQGLQRRTPSLDDVLRAVRGGTSCPPAEPPAQYAHTSSQGPAAVGGPLREKSDSDTILDAQSTPSSFSQQSSSQFRHGHSVQDTNSNTLQPSLAAPQEGVVFHPVLKRAPLSRLREMNSKWCPPKPLTVGIPPPTASLTVGRLQLCRTAWTLLWQGWRDTGSAATRTLHSPRACHMANPTPPTYGAVHLNSQDHTMQDTKKTVILPPVVTATTTPTSTRLRGAGDTPGSPGRRETLSRHPAGRRRESPGWWASSRSRAAGRSLPSRPLGLAVRATARPAPP